MVLFGTRPKLEEVHGFNVQIDGQEVERLDSFKYLGVMVDSHLMFSDHVKYIQSKTVSKIKLLGRAHSFLSQELCISLYKSLILPLFDFNCYIYDCLSSRDAFTLQKLQNSAVRSILRAEFRTPIIELHTKAGLPMLEVRRQKSMATEMYKIYNKLAPNVICNRFHRTSEISSAITRAVVRGDLYMPKVRLQITKHSFCFRGIMVWNGLPIEARMAESLEIFKK